MLPLPITVGGSVGRTLLVGPQEAPSGFTTITAALREARSGDVIYIQPGEYDENIEVTTDYVTMIGAQLGGYGRPDLTATAGVVLTVTAQGFVAQRLRFASGDGSDCVKQEGNGFRYEDCVFDAASDAGKCGLRLAGNDDDDSYTASEGIVTKCLFRDSAIGIVFDTGAAPANGVGCTDDVIERCRFVGNTQDITTADTGGGVYSVQRSLVKDCTFEDKAKTNYIDLTTANGGAASDQTGCIAGCYFATDSITDTNVAMVGTGFTLVGCYDTVGIEDGSDQDD
jgi:hypothetical protein